MKFGGHETFSLRDNWLFKGMQLLKTHGDLFADRDEAITRLGVGTNMTKSIRHWLLATGFATLRDNKLTPDNFGQLIHKYDPFYDYLGTIWLIHYQLACNEKHATTWFWFFNKFSMSQFNIESANHYLESYCQSLSRKVSNATSRRDLNVLLRMYVEEEFNNKTPEELELSPLARLALIKKRPNNSYQLVGATSDNFPCKIFAYTLVRFWQTALQQISQFSFDTLLTSDTSPAKVFCLSVDSTIELIEKSAKIFPEDIYYRQSGGYFIVEINDKIRTENMLQSYYQGE